MKSKFSNPPGDTCECIRSEFLIHGLKRSFCSLRTYRSCILLLFAKGAQSRSSNAQKVLSINSLSLGTFVLHLCKCSTNAAHRMQLLECNSPNATRQVHLAVHANDRGLYRGLNKDFRNDSSVHFTNRTHWNLQILLQILNFKFRTPTAL